MGDPLSSLNSAVGGLDDDFAIADRLLHDLQSDHNCHDLDNQWDTVTFPNPTDVEDLDLSQYPHDRNISTGLTQSLCTAGLQVKRS